MMTDAAVALEYREAGENDWNREVYPAANSTERSVFDQTLDYTARNMFAGVFFTSEPDTEYEVRFTLSFDPDGVTAALNERLISVTPPGQSLWPFSGGRTLYVYPLDHTGPEEQPSYHGLLQAYYMAGLGGDWSRLYRPRQAVSSSMPGYTKEFNRRSYS